MPLGSKMAPPRGSLAPIDLQWEKHKKNHFSETTRPRAFIFCQYQCIVFLFINPANHAPGVHTGPAPGASWEKLLLRNHKTQSFHILCVAMYSGPLYKSCQPFPWGPYGPRPGGSWVKHKKNLLLRNHKA